MAKQLQPPDPAPTRAGKRLLRATDLANRLRGARLVYGKPVRAKSRTVIPVASVSVAGGMGLGRNRADGSDDGGGGGGALRAAPVGYIEITEDGTRFKRIIDTAGLVKIVAVVAGAAVAGAAIQGRRGRGRPRFGR